MPLDAEVFLDAAYLVALAQPGDQHHSRAVELATEMARSQTSVVTTQAVLLEVGSSLSRLRHRQGAVRLIESLRASRLVSILAVSDELARAGWELFRNRPDKEWSWADCISFVVMQESGLRQALTTDEHFVQAGFIALLRE